MGHKTNSTYATDFDVARNYHICSLFRTGMKSWGDLSFINPQTRDTGTSTSTDFSTGLFYPALAGVNFTFHKAIRPRQKYEICTRVLSWDEKWLHLISHFVERGTCKAVHFSDQNGQPDPERDTGIADSRDHGQLEEGSPRAVIFATAMAKIVFKKGRKTISPSRFLGDCGLLPQQDGDWKVPVQESVNQPRDENEKDHENMANLKIGETIERMRADGYRLSEHLNSLEDGYSFYNVNESVYFSKC
ncbi:hypothetical protein N7533_011561 [Penicillium manginii]|uniref:uncharacterized protein n=1 Tax=Penicillium manginii TaxID=203109 RepID=UPI0025495155|nr:uncharacterized protein N7533_011561 [Penicillium manginii]KAJ5742152.1 hypothetical protein N7533_011561 [Penicillium manginii]